MCDCSAVNIQQQYATHTFTRIKYVFLSTQVFSKSEKGSPQSFSEFLPTERTSLSLSVPINLILNK